MKTTRTFVWLAAMGLPLLTSAQGDGAAIVDCGELLPEDSHYSLKIELDWDRRVEPGAGQMSVSLTDELLGRRPESVPAEAAEFVGCVMDALGVPGEERQARAAGR